MNTEEKITNQFIKESEEYKHYGDLTELNKGRDLLNTVGKETLERIADGYLDMLETSAAIYEADGSYATTIFFSSYCKLMDSSSRKLCINADNADALASGQWLCHESCWTKASRITIETGRPYDLRPCEGGINIYAVPIKASGRIIGSINCGYGSPPSDDKTIDELVEKYKVDKRLLLEVAKEYSARPEYIVEAVKRQLLLSAELIGDIYERNKLAATLSEKEEQLRTAFEFSTIGIAIISPEKGFIRVNDEICRMMGYTREELMRMTWAEITHPDDIESNVKQVNRVLVGEIDGFNLDKRYIRKDGTVLYATLWVNCKRSGDGKVDYNIAMLQDITERKKTEEALQVEITSRQVAENRLNLLLEASFEGIVIIEDGRIIDCNKRYAEMFGYTPGELLGRSVFDIVTPQYREMAKMRVALGYDKPYEIDGLKKDGTVVTTEACGRTIVYKGRTVRLTALRDITERKKMEEELRLQSEIIMNMEEGVILTKTDNGKIVYVNPKLNKMFGYDEGELIDNNISIVNAPTDVSPEEVAGQIISSIIETGSWQGEVFNIKKDGTRFWCHAVVSTFKHNTYGTVWISVHQDITERKQAEKELLKVSKQLLSIMESSGDVIAMMDTEYRYVLFNTAFHDEFKKIFGLDLKTGDSMLHALSYLPEDLTNAVEYWNRALGGEDFIVTQQFGNTELERNWYELRFNPVRDGTGKVIGAVHVVRNIADRKQIEEALRISEERLSMALEAAEQGIYDLDLRTGNAIVSPTYALLLGYDPLDFHETDEKCIERMHPDDKELVSSYYRAYLNGEVPEYKAKFRQKTQDGKWKWVLSIGKIVECDIDGRPIRMTGTITDITELKRMEEDLKELNMNLEQRVDEETNRRMVQERMLIQQSKMAAMGEMIANIAHQWKQPLNSLGLFIQDIRDAYRFGELNEAYIDTAVEKSMREIQFMSKTVEDFRNFFKPSYKKEPICFVEVVSEVFSMVSARFKTNSISYIITCHPHNKSSKNIADITPCDMALIMTYKNHLAHVVLNIINNANDAIMQRRRIGLLGLDEEGMISVDCFKEGQTVKLSISDNGGGIPENIMSRIFEPYFTTKSEVEGTGIGLYMSKIIVEDKLGGSIDVKNIDGGAIITLEFKV
ncbi:MAG: PAS domain S-box protein [Nitrospirae bacterium]|nr:PAS domain S-box protein [Nitrospirota bacterium]MBF0553291.1 PAS domain S-box protein [Nitrospirota bacterium]